MAAVEDVIQFRPGPQGATSYFYLAHLDPCPRDARVSLIAVGKIKKQVLKRQEGPRPITNLQEYLLAALPPAFTDQLEQAEVDVVAAWGFMVDQASRPKPERSMRTQGEAQVNRDQAERLARILATVAGGRKAPEDLLAELLALVQAHGTEAIGILRDWAKQYGFTKRGQFVIVGNRANRARAGRKVQAPTAIP